MEKETLGTLLLGGSVTAVLTYIVNVFTKRSDRADALEERIRQLEISHRDLVHIKEKQAEVDKKIDNLLEVMSLIRIQLNAVINTKGNTNG